MEEIIVSPIFTLYSASDVPSDEDIDTRYVPTDGGSGWTFIIGNKVTPIFAMLGFCGLLGGRKIGSEPENA